MICFPYRLLISIAYFKQYSSHSSSPSIGRTLRFWFNSSWPSNYFVSIKHKISKTNYHGYLFPSCNGYFNIFNKIVFKMVDSNIHNAVCWLDIRTIRYQLVPYVIIYSIHSFRIMLEIRIFEITSKTTHSNNARI